MTDRGRRRSAERAGGRTAKRTPLPAAGHCELDHRLVQTRSQSRYTIGGYMRVQVRARYEDSGHGPQSKNAALRHHIHTPPRSPASCRANSRHAACSGISAAGHGLAEARQRTRARRKPCPNSRSLTIQIRWTLTKSIRFALGPKWRVALPYSLAPEALNRQNLSKLHSSPH